MFCFFFLVFTLRKCFCWTFFFQSFKNVSTHNKQWFNWNNGNSFVWPFQRLNVLDWLLLLIFVESAAVCPMQYNFNWFATATSDRFSLFVSLYVYVRLSLYILFDERLFFLFLFFNWMNYYQWNDFIELNPNWMKLINVHKYSYWTVFALNAIWTRQTYIINIHSTHIYICIRFGFSHFVSNCLTLSVNLCEISLSVCDSIRFDTIVRKSVECFHTLNTENSIFSHSHLLISRSFSTLWFSEDAIYRALTRTIYTQCTHLTVLLLILNFAVVVVDVVVSLVLMLCFYHKRTIIKSCTFSLVFKVITFHCFCFSLVSNLLFVCLFVWVWTFSTITSNTRSKSILIVDSQAFAQFARDVNK